VYDLTGNLLQCPKDALYQAVSPITKDPLSKSIPYPLVDETFTLKVDENSHKNIPGHFYLSSGRETYNALRFLPDFCCFFGG